jgi:hypothetical protein
VLENFLRRKATAAPANVTPENSSAFVDGLGTMFAPEPEKSSPSREILLAFFLRIGHNDRPKTRRNMSYRRKQYICLAITALCLSLPLIPSASADFINLGGVADYAVVGVGGSVSITSDFRLYQSDTIIDGNVAEGPYTVLGHGIDSTVHGRWDYDLTDADPSQNGYTGLVTGGFHQINLMGVAADARAAAAQAFGYAATQTFASLTNGQTVVGNGGLNVIHVTGSSGISGGGSTFTLQGTASDYFIFQFTTANSGHILTLSGTTMNITGVNPDHIYWAFNGLGGDLVISSGATVYGNFLAPDRQIVVDHGDVTGRLIGGGSGTLLNIHSSSHVIPEPSTLASLVIGLALVAGIRGRAAMRRQRH